MYRQLPKVSVVTITYGHQDYILETIKGVLMQDYSGEIEFIIANDNSPDETHRVVTEFLNTNSIPPRFEIKYTKHEKNLGMMPNFIWALKQAKGKYIALCEGDDYWTDPLKLQKQVDFLEANPDYSMTFSNFSISDEQGNVIKKYGWEPGPKIINLKTILLNRTPQTLTVVFKSEYIDEITKKSSNYPIRNGDVVLFSLLAKYGSVYYFDEILGNYRQSSNGIWSERSLDYKLKMRFITFKSLLKIFSNDSNATLSILIRLRMTSLTLSIINFKKFKFISSFIFLLNYFKYKFLIIFI